MAEKTPVRYELVDAGDATEEGGVVSDFVASYGTAKARTGTPKQKFKMTEVGLIPEDWTSAPIAELMENIIDYRGRTPKKLGMEWGGGDIPALSAGNVKFGSIDFSAECYTGSDALYQRWMTRGDARRGDIVFTMEAPLGNAALIPDDRRYILSQRTILLQVLRKRLDSTFIIHHLLSDGFQRILRAQATGTTASGIQRKKFEKLHLPLPPLAEQQAIAAALSDVDALLEALDRLIAKKRDLKQAAMQELLTGKHRLPGFTGKWETKRLGDVANIKMGRTPSRKNSAFWGTGHTWLSIADLTSKVITTSSEEITDDAATMMEPIETGTLLMSFKLSIGRLAFAGRRLYTNEAICSFSDPTANTEFLYYLLGRTDFSLYGKQAVKGYTLNMESLASVELHMPGEDDEQAAIAAVLSDMDAEIAALESRREKTKALKQGMMQELMTGRIRLP